MVYILQENIVDDLKVPFFSREKVIDHLRDDVLNIKFSDLDYEDIKSMLEYLEIDYKIVVPLPTQTMSNSILKETEGARLISYEDYVRAIKKEDSANIKSDDLEDKNLELDIG